MTHDDVGICSFNIKTGAKPRSVVFPNIGGINGYAHIDTCASYSLNRRLLEQGYAYQEEHVEITLADGVKRKASCAGSTS